MILPAEFAEPLARAAPRLGPFGSQVRWLPEVGSTNDAAARLAEAGAGEGLVVIAETQSAGRGRLGRSWISPAGAGIYASVVLHPAGHVTPLITLAAGVAIAEGIEAATGVAPRVKWPNDVLLGTIGPAADRKVAGILAESGQSTGGRRWVVLGFGINVLSAAYPPPIAARATSLEAEIGRVADRGLVLAECLAALWARYRDLDAERAATVVSAWRARAASTFGRAVEWDADGQPQRGQAIDIDPSGALLVTTVSGVRRVIAGEVRWI